MTAGAGSMQVVLGGQAIYGGKEVVKPVMGYGREPNNQDVIKALSLVNKTLLLWYTTIVLGFSFYRYANY